MYTATWHTTLLSPKRNFREINTMEKGFIAIDLGAESGRAVVGVLNDGVVQLEEVHRFPHEIIHLPTGMHWDVTGLWREILSGLESAAKWAAAQNVKLLSVGVDTWGVDWALVSASGELAGLPHAYRDPRNDGAFDCVVKKLGVDAIYGATGIQLLALNSLYSLFAQCQASPETVESADQLLFMPDLFHYWLSGRRSVEATVASTSQMADCRTGGWETGMLDQLGIPARLLNATSPPGTTLGPILPKVAELTGLSPSVQVVLPPAHDTASAIAAVPAEPGNNWCYLSSGTWSLLGAELPTPCTTAEAQAAMFTNELGMGGRFRFLKNITGLWMVQECRRDLERQGQAFDYEQLTELAAAAKPFRTLVDPGDAAFQTPGNMQKKICDFAVKTDQTTPRTPGQFVRCCLESLALTYRRTLASLEQVLNHQFEILHIVGGGGQNILLNQMAADATGKRVKVGPFEATAIGNILTQALAAGAVADLEELRNVVAASSNVKTYRPEEPTAWESAEQRFTQLST
ncbi:rhamnulokinase [Pirellulales bacterium]|nr:rhamnulokinase [Pirellulales bacterium]